MYDYDEKENIIKDFEEFKSNEIETDLQKLIDWYIMSLYYDILDYCAMDKDYTAEDIAQKIENIIKEYYKKEE